MTLRLRKLKLRTIKATLEQSHRVNLHTYFGVNVS